jgi:hypothetical protein
LTGSAISQKETIGRPVIRFEADRQAAGMH